MDRRRAIVAVLTMNVMHRPAQEKSILPFRRWGCWQC